MLKKLLKDYPTDNVAVVFDPKGKTFRDDIYSEYKANRDQMPDELACQIKPLFKIIEALGFPLVIVDGYEADDVIGTLVCEAKKYNLNSLVSTGDKDLAQLVDEQVTLINTMNDTILDQSGVEKKFGIPPHLMIDYLSLVGDNVDNIPGIPGVGPKTAVKWLTAYGNLNNVIANASDIKGKIGEKFRDNLENLKLSKTLVTIKCDIDLPFHFDSLTKRPENKQQLKQLFEELEFKNWLAEIKQDTKPKKKYITILSKDELKSWIEKIKSKKFMAFDTETTSLNYMDAKIVGVSFSIDEHEAVYVPLAHEYIDVPNQIGCEQGLELLRPILEDPKILKVGHHLKYDMTVLANHQITLQGLAHDTMLESFLLSSSSRHDLDSVALKYLGHTNIKFEEVAGKGAKQKTFDQVSIEQATDYAAEDADICLQIHQKCYPQIKAKPKLDKILTEIEVPLISILSEIERTGVLIDAEHLNALSYEFTHKIDHLVEKAYSLAGETFNLSSPKQLQGILYDKLQLPILEKTATGQASTAESVLQELAADYELPRVILDYRSLTKLRSTYTDKLPKNINLQTGRVHTSYHQAGAWTGRFSSTDPNLQNIPIRSEEGRRIRQAFIAPKGYKILAADYSQIELRIMAHLSGDQGLLEAFKNDKDIHQATAAEVFDVPLDGVTNLQRRDAKAINFGLIYGMSAYGLAKQLAIDRSQAQAYIDKYFERYPKIKAYMDKTKAHAHELGYVETLFGRELHLPEINSSNIQRQRAAERTAINAPMQGTAADIIKRAMINVAALIKQKKWDVRMIMQVHDELIFEVAENILDEFQNPLSQAMANAADLAVPLTVGIGIGDNWDQAH